MEKEIAGKGEGGVNKIAGPDSLYVPDWPSEKSLFGGSDNVYYVSSPFRPPRKPTSVGVSGRVIFPAF
jgi:hypothetical protein